VRTRLFWRRKADKPYPHTGHYFIVLIMGADLLEYLAIIEAGSGQSDILRTG